MRADTTLHYSKQREKIYEYLISSREHPTADMVYIEARKAFPSISLGTVYRNLKLLEELGKIKRVITPGSMERYDAKCEEHAHFVCRCCGCLEDCTAADIEAIWNMCGVGNRNRVLSANILFEGICETCGQKKAAG